MSKSNDNDPAPESDEDDTYVPMPGDDYPWLPPDETLDPLEHADVYPDESQPLVVTPRGGAREIGRSCYQVDSQEATWLVDCGLSPGDGEKFPDFRGLGIGGVDAVFLTHAHLDHCGALPVLENRGYLEDDAPIVTTEPTVQLAETMLVDSLHIHEQRVQRGKEEKQFDESDVERVCDRMVALDYENGLLHDVAPVPESAVVTFSLGNAAHLLGSAWVSFQTMGRRVLFSGDLGGRAPHLPDIETPPGADLLVLESTYGNKHSHQSFTEAESDLFETIETAVRQGTPVLIPVFSIGRAQALLLMLDNRLTSQSPELKDNAQVILDGMAQDATELYHLHVTDENHMSESVVNRAVNSGVTEPFYPTGLEQPETDGQRAQLLEDVDPVEGEEVPIILSTAGMLHAGHAPRYLSELVSRFHDYRLCLTGYQAVGTPGRAVQNATEAGADTVPLELDISPFEASWQTTPDVQPVENGSSGQTARVIVDTDKVETYSGFSGHAAQHGLLDFVRAVEPNTAALVHGEPFAQRGLAEHIASNVDAVEQVTPTRLLTPIPVTRDPELATVTIETADTDRDIYDIAERLQQQVTELSREVANLRQQSVSKTDVEKMIEQSDKTPSE